MIKNKSSKPIIVFAYNAQSGMIHAALDSLHKIVSPKTYPCTLCKITHHNLGAREEWTLFLSSIPLEKEFWHKNELSDTFTYELPCVLLKYGDRSEKLLNKTELSNLTNLSALILKLKEKLHDYL